MSRKSRALEFAEATYNIQITGRHIEITDSIKSYVIEKISKIDRFLMDQIIDVNVILDVQKIDHRVEIVLKAGSTKITSRASSKDMYTSIDEAVHKLEAQILRYKSKLQDHHAKGHATLNMAVSVLSSKEGEEDWDVGGGLDQDRGLERFKPHRIIKVEERPLRTLTYDEAIMKMELSADVFMIFKSEVDQKLKVIYRRHDGNYGIIEPHCGM